MKFCVSALAVATLATVASAFAQELSFDPVPGRATLQEFDPFAELIRPVSFPSEIPPEILPPVPTLQTTEDPLEVFEPGLVESDARFTADFSPPSAVLDVGTDFYSEPDFLGGLIVFGQDVALKIGGYVKADFIQDFNPIDNMDAFDTTSIPVGAAPRTNSRYHARQTRLSFDTRWLAQQSIVRILVEGDFFSEDNQFRLRHAYGEVGTLLVGQTWTTFTDVAAAPATLDFEGSVSGVNRRQAQARWTPDLGRDYVSVAFAVEDTRFIIEQQVGVIGQARSPSPDFVARARLRKDWGQFQVAMLYRQGGFQEIGQEVRTASALGLNNTGVLLLTARTKAYFQFLFGNGIGSYRGLPDAAPVSATETKVLGMFGWMLGLTREWNPNLSSNVTYAENSLENTLFQSPDDVHRTTYLAVNLICSPRERVDVGIEYLYGIRENIDRRVGAANRVQISFVFDLP